MVPGAHAGAAERAADDPARRRAGHRRLPGHRRGDGCRPRPARAGQAGHAAAVPPRPRALNRFTVRDRLPHRGVRVRSASATASGRSARSRPLARGDRLRVPLLEAPSRCAVCTVKASASNTPIRWRIAPAAAESAPARHASPLSGGHCAQSLQPVGEALVVVQADRQLQGVARTPFQRCRSRRGGS